MRLNQLKERAKNNSANIINRIRSSDSWKETPNGAIHIIEDALKNAEYNYDKMEKVYKERGGVCVTYIAVSNKTLRVYVGATKDLKARTNKKLYQFGLISQENFDDLVFAPVYFSATIKEAAELERKLISVLKTTTEAWGLNVMRYAHKLSPCAKTQANNKTKLYDVTIKKNHRSFVCRVIINGKETTEYYKSIKDACKHTNLPREEVKKAVAKARLINEN